MRFEPGIAQLLGELEKAVSTSAFLSLTRGKKKNSRIKTVYATYQGEIRVLFAHSVRQSNTLPSASFPQFTLLVPEPQLRALRWCEKSALFQLMHTSPSMHAEASKLFFSNSKAVYWIDTEWILEGGHLGNTLCDLDFILHVEYLYIEFS